MSGFDAEVDVLVVGAGACGLAAALRAAEHGSSVAIVEKLDRLAGNSMVSSGSVPGAGTRFQREAGLRDGPEDYAEDLLRISGPHQAEHLTHRLAAISAPLVEWLVDVAHTPMTLITAYRHVGHRIERLHGPPSRRGRDLVDGLHAAVERAGIPLAFGTPATRLIGDGRGGVIGAETDDGRGGRTRIGAGSVILATNGFGAARDLLARFCPEMAEASYFGAQGSEGEAVRWGEALGAELANMGAYQAHASVADPHGALVTWTVPEKGGIVVDARGERFGNESLGYSAFAALETARGGALFAVYDMRIRDFTASRQEEFGELVAHGGCPEDATIEALAARRGMDPAVLAATLAEAERVAAGAAPDRFGRTAWGMAPLRPPYVSTRIKPALFHTQGGLSVDGDARVLRPDGTPIPGLYAGGGAAAGISGRAGGGGYTSGNGLLAALGLGWLAGSHAASCAKGA
jgi:fumarate reductase flavoprotein subunit